MIAAVEEDEGVLVRCERRTFCDMLLPFQVTIIMPDLLGCEVVQNVRTPAGRDALLAQMTAILLSRGLDVAIAAPVEPVANKLRDVFKALLGDKFGPSIKKAGKSLRYVVNDQKVNVEVNCTAKLSVPMRPRRLFFYEVDHMFKDRAKTTILAELDSQNGRMPAFFWAAMSDTEFLQQIYLLLTI